MLTDASLMGSSAVILMSSNKGTGWGKSQIALRMAIEWCIAYNKANNEPPEDALVVCTTSIDAARGIEMKKGMCWVLDDISPSDRDQIIYCSENMLKCLFCAKSRAQVRGRQEDIKVPPGCARILTCNAEGPEEWLGSRAEWSEPLRRKAILFQLTNCLVSAGFRRSVNASNNVVFPNLSEQSQLMKNTFTEGEAEAKRIHDAWMLANPEPPTIFDRLFNCPRRGDDATNV